MASLTNGSFAGQLSRRLRERYLIDSTYDLDSNRREMRMTKAQLLPWCMLSVLCLACGGNVTPTTMEEHGDPKPEEAERASPRRERSNEPCRLRPLSDLCVSPSLGGSSRSWPHRSECGVVNNGCGTGTVDCGGCPADQRCINANEPCHGGPCSPPHYLCVTVR